MGNVITTSISLMTHLFARNHMDTHIQKKLRQVQGFIGNAIYKGKYKFLCFSFRVGKK